MYAAIEDPTNQADLYTSGSETYAQIQPQETVVVSVEINTLQTISPSVSPPIIHSPVAPIVVNHVTFSNQMTNLPNSIISSPRHSIVNDEPSTNPTPVDILKAAHSRQGNTQRQLPRGSNNIFFLIRQHHRPVARVPWAIWVHRNPKSVKPIRLYRQHQKHHTFTIKVRPVSSNPDAIRRHQ